MITLNLKVHKAMLNFSEDAKQKCILDIDNYFDNDDWCKNIPHYQTWPVLFDRTEHHWVELKKQITEQVETKYEIKNLKCKAWAYVCMAGQNQNYNKQNGWHSHDKVGSLYSAIFYLNAIDGFEATEFMDVDGDVYRPKLTSNLLIYFDSKLCHRPAIWDGKKHNQNRYVISVDYRK